MSNIIKSISVTQGDSQNFVIDYNLEQDVSFEENKIDVHEDDDDNNSDDISIREVNKIMSEREKELEFKEKELNEKADAILKSASDSAQTILASARIQAETIKIEAAKEGGSKGYDDGFKKGEAKVEQLMKDLEEEYNTKKELFEEKASKFESEFVDLASSIIEKITGLMVEDKKEVIMHLINRALGNCENSNTYIIRVSKEDFDYVNSYKQRILDVVKEDSQVEIVETEKFISNKCIIETDNTVIDCSLDSQLDNLIEYLKILSNIE